MSRCALSTLLRSSCIKQYILLLSIHVIVYWLQVHWDDLRGLLAQCLGLLFRLLVEWWCVDRVVWCVVESEVDGGVVWWVWWCVGGCGVGYNRG